MTLLEIAIISIGLAMDAFAVSVCKGLSMQRFELKKMFVVGAYFGFFQGGMPLIGYLLGTNFESMVTRIDHWIAFGLLALIGINMIREAIGEESEKVSDSVDLKTMVVLAIATSIDALAVGITFAFLKTNLWIVVSSIGIITFVLSMLGVVIGNKFGNKYERKAQIVGGTILILMGTKILMEHLGIINF